MKIAIAVDSKTLKSSLATRFGRAPYFAIYAEDKQDYQFIANQSVNASGGAGVQAAQVLIDADVKCLIAPKVGPKAYRVLEAAQIEIWQGRQESLQENIELYFNDKLQQIGKANGVSHSL